MKGSNLFVKHTAFVITCIILFGIIISDFLFANAYKVITGEYFYDKIMNPSISIERKYRIPSNIYHHGLKKNITAPAIWGPRNYRMITNSLGFRDKENREIEMKSNKYRILFMGDSFVEGTGVDYTHSFVGILAQKYADKYEILNGGVISYAPTVYFLKSRYFIEKYKLKFDEMILFIDISDINNEMETYANYDENIINKVNAPTGTTVSSQSTAVGIKRFFRRNSILYGIPRFIKSRKVNSIPASFDPEKNPTINHRRALWTIDKKYYNEYGKAGLEKAKINVIKLKKILDEHNIKITLIVYPWPTQIYYNDLKSIQVSEWKIFCEKNAISFFNLFPYFISKNSDNNKKIILKYYIENDMHWNEKGNQMVANVLKQKLEVFNQDNKND